MSTMRRPLAGPMLSFELADHIAQLRSDPSYARTGRLGRTLAKSGRLRIVLVVLERDAEVETHHADAPMTIQPIEGAIRFRVGGDEHQLRKGQVLYFGSGDAQHIRATERTALLLTLSMLEEASGPSPLGKR
jgi:quercetin dioxygenase-like cupin family protein